MSTAPDAAPVTARRRSAPLGALLLAGLLVCLVAPSCSSSRDLVTDRQTGTTIRVLRDDGSGDDAIAGGSEGARQIQEIIDRLVQSDDACAILTQKDVRGYQIDATTLASSSARRVLTNGVIAVYDHLIKIMKDRAVVPALQSQRDTFVQVLDVVDRYAANPTAKQGNEQINALLTGDAFVQAQNQVAVWTSTNCG